MLSGIYTSSSWDFIRLHFSTEHLANEKLALGLRLKKFPGPRKDAIEDMGGPPRQSIANAGTPLHGSAPCLQTESPVFNFHPRLSAEGVPRSLFGQGRLACICFPTVY